MERRIVKLLGFNVDIFDQGEASSPINSPLESPIKSPIQEAVNYAMSLLEEKNGGQVVTINPEMIEYGLKNSEFAQILNNADLVIPDGVGVKIGLKIKGVNASRIAGIEFSHKLIEQCAQKNISVGLIGAKPQIIEKAAQNLKTEFEKLNIVYVQDGYFQDREAVLTELKEKAPQFVLVALGSPKQEEFIVDARKLLPESLMIGVGGSFDVWSGEVQRAPEIYQKLGLEWLYRTLKEPQRFKRIFPTLPRFILRVLLS